MTLKYFVKQEDEDNPPPEKASFRVNDSFSKRAPAIAVVSGDKNLNIVSIWTSFWNTA